MLSMSKALDGIAFRQYVGSDWLPVVGGLLILYVPTFYDLAGSHWVRNDHAHGPIVLAVVIWLIWTRRQIVLADAPRIAPVPGIALLTLGLLFYVVGRAHGVVSFEVGALAPILAGTLLSMRGWPALRQSWFALLFIAFLVPLPGSFVDALTLPMKQEVSEIATQILYAAGYPIGRSGVVLTIGQYQLLVGDACAGLNSMFSLTAVGLLYMYVMHRKNWIHNALMLASLVPISFCANTIRVIILVLVTYRFGDAAGQGFVHGFSGLVLFVFALIAVVLLDTVLVKCIKSRPLAK
jgi:exosortase B